VTAYLVPDHDDDELDIYVTSGSSHEGEKIYLGRFHRDAHSKGFEVFRNGERVTS
jgi:hypothetical protein